jgi:hypothetical protein
MGPCYPRCAPTYGPGGIGGPRSHRLVNGVFPTGAEVWTPAQPTAGGYLPEHWYRSDDAYQDAARTTPDASDGDVIGSKTDLTANTDHISQANVGNKPTWQSGAGDLLNGHPVVRFDAIDDYLQGAFTTGGSMAQPNTLFAVAKLDNALIDDNVSRYLLDGDDAANRQALYKSFSTTPDSWAMYFGAAAISGTAGDANWNIWTAVANGAASQFWHNGISEAIGNSGAHAMDGLTLGTRYDGTGPWGGDVVEVILYEQNLSNADKNQVGQYLAARYALTYTDI